MPGLKKIIRKSKNGFENCLHTGGDGGGGGSGGGGGGPDRPAGASAASGPDPV